MRKEVLLAVIFGIILGGVILYGIQLANKSVSQAPLSPQRKVVLTPTPIIIEKNVEVIYPLDHAVLTDKEITLTGNARQSSTVAIITELDDLIVDVSPEGSFSAEINLVSGENSITITSLLPDNTTETVTLTIIQTTTIPE